MNWNWHRLLAAFGLAAPLVDSGVCRCRHRRTVHERWEPWRTHCGPCGTAGCGRYRPLWVTEEAHVDGLISAAWIHTAAGERVDAERAVAEIATRGPNATWRLLAWCASTALTVTVDLDDLPVVADWDDAGLWAATFVHAYELQLFGQERAQFERLTPVDQHERAVALLHLAVTACGEAVR